MTLYLGLFERRICNPGKLLVVRLGCRNAMFAFMNHVDSKQGTRSTWHQNVVSRKEAKTIRKDQRLTVEILYENILVICTVLNN